MRINTLYILLLLLVTASQGVAQNGLTTYPMPAGYTSLQLRFRNDLKCDPNGNVWVAFRDIGLGRFDGVTWQMYDSLNSGLPVNEVTALAVAGSMVYAGTARGLAVYDGAGWTIYDSLDWALPTSRITCTGVAPGGDVWIGTNLGACRYDGNTWTSFNQAGGLAGDTINQVRFGQNGEVWLATTEGVTRYFAASFTNFNTGNSVLPVNNIRQMVVDGNNTAWAFCWDGTKDAIILFNGISPTAVYPYELLAIKGHYVNSLNTYNSNYVVDGNNDILFMGSLLFITKWSHSAIIQKNGDNIASDYFVQAKGGLIGWGIVIDLDTSNRLWLLGKYPQISYSDSCIWSFDFSQYPTPILGSNGLSQTYENTRYVDGNNVRATIINRGDMHWDLSNSGYEVPKGSGRHSVFSSAMWIGGLDNLGLLHMAGQTYRQTGCDFWPGPVEGISVPFDSASCAAFDHVWIISSSMIDDFKANWAQPGYVIPQDILYWPAKGNGIVNADMAPFFDFDNNGFYDAQSGDYPIIEGDKMAYWVFNDSLAPHTETGGRKLGIQTQAFAYMYYCDTIAGAPSVLNYSTYYKYQVKNISANLYTNVYIGLRCDVDLGNYYDDFVGCKVDNDAGFVYNGDNLDDGSGGYGLNPPMQNVMILRGPEPDLNDGLDNDHDGMVDEPGERCMMNHFQYHYNVNGTPTGNPSQALFGIDYYHYLISTWLDGTPVTQGGNGYGGSIPTNYMYDGVPYSGAGWSEQTAGNAPSDRWFILSSGPFSLAPGQVQEIDFAYVFSHYPSAPNGLNTSIAANDSALQIVRDWYVNNSIPSCGTTGIADSKSDELPVITIFPVPAKDELTVRVSGLLFRETPVVLADLTSRPVKTAMLPARADQIRLDVSDLAGGMYLLIAEFPTGIAVKRLVKL